MDRFCSFLVSFSYEHSVKLSYFLKTLEDFFWNLWNDLIVKFGCAFDEYQYYIFSIFINVYESSLQKLNISYISIVIIEPQLCCPGNQDELIGTEVFTWHFGDTACYKIYVIFIEIACAQFYKHPAITLISVFSILVTWCCTKVMYHFRYWHLSQKVTITNASNEFHGIKIHCRHNYGL